jgi:hypothetical protein
VNGIRAKRGHLALLAGALATHAACLYIAPINERPRARVEEMSVGPYTIGDQVVVSASKSTDDGDAANLRVTWQARICDESGACEPVELSSVSPSVRDDIGVTVDRKGELVVLATVTDGQGASDTIDLRIDVINAAPTIEVQVNAGFPDPGDSGGYVLGLPVEIVAEILDTDGDELATSWVAFPPMGSTSTRDVVAVDGADETYTLDADDPGVWEVRITADDGDGGQVEHTEPIVFAVDGPPCIGATSPVAGPSAIPIVVDGEPTRFSVLSVFDALDGYPRPANPHPAVGEATFAWKLASPGSGGSFVDLSNPVADLVIDPALYEPGDRLALRVEVDDRNVFFPLGCDEAQPLCNADDTENPAPSCTQRTTWEIEIR